MAYEFRLTRRVEFFETDMAGIVHFSNFFRYMEHAEHAFYRSLGFSVVDSRRQPPIGWPRVHAECDYAAPLLYAELVDIELRVAEIRASTLTYLFRFVRAADGREVATGKLTVCCVTRDPETERMQAVPIPPEFATLVEAAPTA